MPPSANTLGPLDDVLATLLETWGKRYDFKFYRKDRVALFSEPPDNEVGAKELPDGRIHVVHQPSKDETAQVFCSPAEAAALIDALMSRETLTPVPLPPAPAPPRPAELLAKRGWLARLFGR